MTEEKVHAQEGKSKRSIAITSITITITLQTTITRQNKTITRHLGWGMKLVVQDMDLKNPVLAVVPRDNQKTITRVRVRVRVVRVRVRVWVKVKVLCLGLGFTVRV